MKNSVCRLGARHTLIGLANCESGSWLQDALHHLRERRMRKVTGEILSPFTEMVYILL